MEAALKLVEIIGCYDPSVSSLYLAFYQVATVDMIGVRLCYY